MKRLFTILAAILLTASLFAQSPQKMSYQAVIRDATNHLVTTQVGMKISILQGSETGEVKYVEVQTPTPNANGLVSIEIGGEDPVAFAAIDWSDGPYFIKTETATAEPLTTYTITGTSQLLSVPYSLHAKTSGTSIDAVRIIGDQTIAGDKTFTGKITGTVDANNTVVSNVADPVNSTDAANKAYVDALMDQLYDQGILQVKDYDGNLYNVVKIGNQYWLKENLKVTHYRNGDPIPNVTNNAEWIGLTAGAYCWQNNDETTYKNTYGALYNWYTAVDSRNLCPSGWHVPNQTEFEELESFLGGLSVAGGKLKESGTAHWINPNTGATNESGFTALPSGNRGPAGTFSSIGITWQAWSSTDDYDEYSYGRGLDNTTANFYYGTAQEICGFCVRCLKD